jgi:hypothetical protein
MSDLWMSKSAIAAAWNRKIFDDGPPENTRLIFLAHKLHRFQWDAPIAIRGRVQTHRNCNLALLTLLARRRLQIGKLCYGNSLSIVA